MKLEPYLFFNGRCDEAIEFYKQAVGAQVQYLGRFKDAPPEAQGSPEGANGPRPDPQAVMHCNLLIGETQLMVSDGMPGSTPQFQGFSLSLTLKDEARAHAMFNALAQGGQVQMPLGKTFYSPCFGMVADKFGVGWMIMVEP